MDEQHDPKPIYGKLDAELFLLARDAGLSRAEAEDVTQAVWLKFFERPPRLCGRPCPRASAWLAPPGGSQ